MKILTSLAVMAFAGSLSAAQLSESFDTWPATGWTIVDNNATGAGWIHDTVGLRAWHQDESGATTDFHLISPAMDLSAMTTVGLHFDSETNYGRWLANNPASIGDGVSTVEVSTDGGATWTVVWDDNTLDSLIAHSPDVSLDAWAGMSGVQIGFHFVGTFAQEWWVDNVVVDGVAAPMAYSIDQFNGFGGDLIAFNVDNATPGSTVIIGYSLAGAGPTATPYGPADMSSPINTLATLSTNGAGGAAMGLVKTAGSAGVTLYTQALDVASGTLTNSLAEVIL